MERVDSFLIDRRSLRAGGNGSDVGVERRLRCRFSPRPFALAALRFCMLRYCGQHFGRPVGSCTRLFFFLFLVVEPSFKMARERATYRLPLTDDTHFEGVRHAWVGGEAARGECKLLSSFLRHPFVFLFASWPNGKN